MMRRAMQPMTMEDVYRLTLLRTGDVDLADKDAAEFELGRMKEK